MRPRHQRQTIVMIERLRNVLTEGVSRASWTDSPAASVIGIRPQKIAHGTLMRYFLNSVERADVVERVDTGRQTAVQAEDLVVNEGGQGQVVEEVREELPHVRIAILAQALIVEAVHLRNLPTLVVAAQDGDALGIADLERDEKRDSLDGEVSTIDVVAHEEVIGVWIGASDLEQLHQVVELAVDVATDCDGTFDGLYVGFVLQHLSRLFAQSSHVVLRELFAGHETLDPAVQARY